MKLFNATLCAAAAALALALPAHADNDGLNVTGTLAFGANGANGGQYWGPQNTVIGAGVEYFYIDGANQDTADFSSTQLTIVDMVFSGANGWEMTFATAGGFTGLTLASSNFDPGLTYSLNNGVIVVDWVGINQAPGTTFTAVFDVTTAAAIPEPETYALMLGGLAALGFVARRRKARASI